MNKLVCGMVVDEDIYDKYNWDKQTGMRRKYTLGGQERSLDIVEFYSTAENCKVFYPEMVADAKKIAAQIQKEIREYYAAKDGRKEYVAMKHDTFGEYLADLQEIHAKVAPERTALKEKMDLAKKRWEENQREFKNDEHFLAREKVKFLDAQEEYKNSVKELQRRTQEEIQAVQAEYEKHVTDFYTANGNRLDDATVRLLNSGIKLTDAEIKDMVNQNKSNPTMLRLISDHCDKQGIGNDMTRTYGVLARKAGSDEREAFKVIADMVEKAVSENETTSSIWSKEESHFKRLSDQQIGAMGAFWVKPEATQTYTAE
ncbi:MAG: hypothetical protein HDR06_11495 [Lachnospiraceae bacterium]|nr:hypothetical protein [Lachnospiraceae bacterium]